jgi:hypothetical protein
MRDLITSADCVANPGIRPDEAAVADRNWVTIEMRLCLQEWLKTRGHAPVRMMSW